MVDTGVCITNLGTEQALDWDTAGLEWLLRAAGLSQTKQKMPIVATR